MRADLRTSVLCVGRLSKNCFDLIHVIPCIVLSSLIRARIGIGFYFINLMTWCEEVQQLRSTQTGQREGSDCAVVLEADRVGEGEESILGTAGRSGPGFRR